MTIQISTDKSSLPAQAARLCDELLTMFCIAGNFDVLQDLGVRGPAIERISSDPAAVRKVIGLIEHDLTQACKAGMLQEMQFSLKHTFADGIYAREMFIPKGSLIVGKIHKQECLNIVSKGDIYIVTETGSARVQAPYSVVSPAGLRRVGYAVEDTIWTNVFRTDETDIAKLEQQLSWASYEEMAAQCIEMSTTPHKLKGN